MLVEGTLGGARRSRGFVGRAAARAARPETRTKDFIAKRAKASTAVQGERKCGYIPIQNVVPSNQSGHGHSISLPVLPSYRSLPQQGVRSADNPRQSSRSPTLGPYHGTSTPMALRKRRTRVLTSILLHVYTDYSLLKEKVRTQAKVARRAHHLHLRSAQAKPSIRHAHLRPRPSPAWPTCSAA